MGEYLDIDWPVSCFPIVFSFYFPLAQTDIEIDKSKQGGAGLKLSELKAKVTDSFH